MRGIFESRAAARENEAKAKLNEAEARRNRDEDRAVIREVLGAIGVSEDELNKAVELMIATGAAYVKDGKVVDREEVEKGAPPWIVFDEATNLDLDRIFGETADLRFPDEPIFPRKDAVFDDSALAEDDCPCPACNLRRSLFGRDGAFVSSERAKVEAKKREPFPGFDEIFEALFKPKKGSDVDAEKRDLIGPEGLSGPEGVTSSDRENLMTVNVRDGYYGLYSVLIDALEQAQTGKGRERHARDGKGFEDQPILKLTEQFGRGFSIGQAVKKIGEAERMFNDGKYKSGVFELLGAINYLAASILYIRKQKPFG